MRAKATWIAVAVALCLVLAVAAVSVVFWDSIGNAGISAAGWIAMIFGVIATLALGIGLMSLVFLSSRRGYDEIDRDQP
jgi:hypothetical protein